MKSSGEGNTIFRGKDERGNFRVAIGNFRFGSVMSVTISDETIADFARDAVSREVAELRPLIRETLLDELKWVTEATGISVLELQGKEPRRTFRRLMNLYGVEYVKLGGIVRWKRSSLERVLEMHTVRGKKLRNGDRGMAIAESKAA